MNYNYMFDAHAQLALGLAGPVGAFWIVFLPTRPASTSWGIFSSSQKQAQVHPIVNNCLCRNEV